METVNARSIFSPATGCVCRGGFSANTGAVARRLLPARGWTEADYHCCVEWLWHLHVCESEAGFFPAAGPSFTPP